MKKLSTWGESRVKGMWSMTRDEDKEGPFNYIPAIMIWYDDEVVN